MGMNAASPASSLRGDRLITHSNPKLRRFVIGDRIVVDPLLNEIRVSDEFGSDQKSIQSTAQYQDVRSAKW